MSQVIPWERGHLTTGMARSIVSSVEKRPLRTVPRIIRIVALACSSFFFFAFFFYCAHERPNSSSHQRYKIDRTVRFIRRLFKRSSALSIAFQIQPGSFADSPLEKKSHQASLPFYFFFFSFAALIQ